ncbi:barstar family protein [Vibrio parahaemolyticus]|uniref:barstar family protein n=1 Tax=Vibrio parahaemolyticus TaxID=670 RepID=UPI001EFC7759|nr:barstar family protein [Vibrio parahaemolyticus]MCG9638298.1 barstar family protein [Vibrio parahaemolyticus]
MQKLGYCVLHPLTGRYSAAVFIRRGIMRIDLIMIENENQLHELMANCFGFPDYYGKNWDAFWDCLCDSDLPKVIEFVGSSHLKSAHPESFESLKSCFDDLSREYPNIGTRVDWN